MKTLSTVAALVVVALIKVASAHEEPAGKPITLLGTVVDTGCYMSHEGTGEKHRACATMCARNGIPLAIVDASGKLYLPIASDHKNANTKLMPFIEQKVRVTGTALEKGGLNGISIKTVEAAR